LTERQNSLNGLKTGKFGRADVNTIKKRKSHGLSFEAAGLEQGRPEEVFDNPEQERTKQFLSSYS